MIQIDQMSYRVGGRPLFDEASLGIDLGWRVGLVGRNGSGKSTLLKLLTGELQPDQGKIGLPRRLSLGGVAQEAPSGPQRLLDTVLAADQERSALLAAAETAPAERQAEVHERLAAIQAESAPARAAKILAGLGFDEETQQHPVDSLSGGWRMRVALAALLFSAPDLLLLHEPTNHLDLEAALWLEGFLKTYPGTLILVSHDRGLLNAVAGKIVHLEGLKLTIYNGNYDRFEETRRARLARVAALNARQEAQRRHIQAFVDRFRYKASKARQAQSRLKALARMQPIASVVEAQVPSFSFPEPESLPPPLVALHDVAVGYEPDKPVLRDLKLRIDSEDRIALLGANGNGKSTFMRLLAKQMQPEAGEVIRSSKLKIGYFAQDQAEALDFDRSALAHLAELRPKDNETQLRGHLGAFGLSGDKAETLAGDLSGGEKARLLFALMTCAKPQILLLDEPTNHLDIDAREALVQALNDFPGAIVLVTHEPHLIELVADRLWRVRDGRIEVFDDDLDSYRALIAAQRRRERAEARQTGQRPDARASKKERRQRAAQNRASLASLRKTVRQAEERLARLQQEKLALEQRLAEPGLYEGAKAEVVDLQTKHSEIAAAVAREEEAWLEAQAALEGATADGAA